MYFKSGDRARDERSENLSGNSFYLPGAEHLQTESHHSAEYCFIVWLNKTKIVSQFYVTATDALFRKRTTVY